jgi:hypothetical protein
MPVLMFKASTSKSPHERNAKELEEALREGVEGAGGRLVCLHSGGGGVAYGVVEGPGGHDYDVLVAVLSVIAEIAGEVISWVTGD